MMKRNITIASEKLRNEIENAYKNGYEPKMIYQPERSKREDDEDPVMKYIAPICDTIIELR